MTQLGLTDDALIVEEYDNQTLDQFSEASSVESDTATDEALSRLQPDDTEDTDPADEADQPGEPPVLGEEVTDTPRVAVPQTIQEELQAVKQQNKVLQDRQDTRDTELAQEQAKRADQAFEATVQSYIPAYQEELESQGWMPNEASQYAQSQAALYIANKRANENLRATTAARIAQGHGVAPSAIIHLNSQEDMEAEAVRLGNQSKKEALIEKRMAAIERSRVPPQNYDQTAARRVGAASENQLLDVYNSDPDHAPPEAVAAARRAALGS
jgi:hypothetical protein